MDVLQVWILAGIPALLLAAALFIGRSAWRSLLGYLVLAIGFAAVASVDRASAVVFGGLLTLLYAAGRGGRLESEDPHVEDTGVPPVAHKHGRPLGSG